ncbi:MAG: DUF5652 family protein [Patescibacteria group bacterium]|nr:DUF5652 family protein [Patescibacteria group bacterium]
MFNSLVNPSFFQGFAPLAILLLAWEFYWKGRGLWKAAQEKALYWFIAMLLLNTLGILPIVYLYLFKKEPIPFFSNKK